MFGGSLAELLRFAGVQHACWKEVAYKMRFSTALALASSSSSQLFNMHFGRKPRRMASFCRCPTCILEGSLVQNAFSRDSGRAKCGVFQSIPRVAPNLASQAPRNDGCGTSSRHSRIMLGYVRIVPPL